MKARRRRWMNGLVLSAALLPRSARASSATCGHAGVHIHADGSIALSSGDPPQTFCLDDVGVDADAPHWAPGGGEVQIVQRSIDGERRAIAGDVGDVIPIPTTPENNVTIEVLAHPEVADPKARAQLVRLLRSDEDLVRSVRMILESHPPLQGDAGTIKRHIERAVDQLYWPVFSGVLPTPQPGGSRAFLALDARDGASRVGGAYADGTTLRGWAYNVACDGPQNVEIVKGAPVAASSSTLGSILAPLIIAGAPKLAGAEAAPSDREKAADEAAAEEILDEVRKRTEALWSEVKKTRHCTTALRTTVLDGGFLYTLQASRPATDGSSKSDAQPAQVNGIVSFKAYSRHSLVGLGVELAFNESLNGFPESGYGYQPVSAASGPDQLYQLQGLNHFQDSITSSAELLFYPLALLNKNPCVNGDAQFLCLGGLLTFGFGPTFVRGGTAEFAKQWNSRIGIEIFPDILVLTGLSWRSIDVPSGPGETLGSIVSVPRPATAPGLATEPRTDLLWSVGIAVDLAVVTRATSAIAKAATSSSAGGGQ